MQAAIDSGNEYRNTCLRMAGAQRLAGEIDAAYATLEHAFALGWRITRKNRGSVELVPFRNDVRFAALRDKSENDLAESRREIAAIRATEPPGASTEIGQDRPESGSIDPL